MKEMHFFEREVTGHRYRIAAQSVWDAQRGRSVARRVPLPKEPPKRLSLQAAQAQPKHHLQHKYHDRQSESAFSVPFAAHVVAPSEPGGSDQD